MKKNTRKVVRLTQGERMLYTLGALCLLFTVVIRVFASASIGNLKMDIEKISYRIDSQTKKNQSLVMQVNELTSYENLNAILKNMGLAYNNKNIVVVK
jgi:cell division protein FtsL